MIFAPGRSLVSQYILRRGKTRSAMLEISFGVLEATLTTQAVIYFLFVAPADSGKQYSLNILCALGNWF